MSGIGRCYDNCRAESIFATLKKEKVYQLKTKKMTIEQMKTKSLEIRAILQQTKGLHILLKTAIRLQSSKERNEAEQLELVRKTLH